MPIPNFPEFTATLDANGLSQAIDLGGCTPFGLRTPASMAGTSITFLLAPSLAGTYLPFRDSSNADISVTIDSTARHYQLDPAKMAGAQFIKLQSNSTSDSGKALSLVSRPV